MAEHATTAGAATLWVFVPVDTIALERESRPGALHPGFSGAVLTSRGAPRGAPPVSAGYSMTRPHRFEEQLLTAFIVSS
jgi:hypothetical protein